MGQEIRNPCIRGEGQGCSEVNLMRGWEAGVLTTRNSGHKGRNSLAFQECR